LALATSKAFDYALLNEAIVAPIAAIGCATDLPRRPCRVVVLLTTAAAVDVRVVMRREGKGTGQMIDTQCMVHTGPATATANAVVCQTKHRHRPSCKFLPP